MMRESLLPCADMLSQVLSPKTSPVGLCGSLHLDMVKGLLHTDKKMVKIHLL